MRNVGTVLFGDEVFPRAAVSLVRDAVVESHADAVVSAALAGVFARWATQGHPVGELSLAMDLKGAAECLRILQGGEVWSTHGRWIESARPDFGPGITERFAAARAMTADQVREAARERAAINARLDTALPPGRILCLPTVPGPAPRRDASPEQLQMQRTKLLPLTALASLTGRPQITLPLLRVDGAPVGVSLLGWRNGDEALLEIAELLSLSC
jgi:amidase